MIMGGAMTCPTSMRPWIKEMPLADPCSISPRVRFFSIMAFSGQISKHPPHEWHRVSKVRTSFFKTAMAPYLQMSMHFLQKVHFSRSISGTGAITGSFFSMTGLRKRCELGSSTSQSRSCTLCSIESARLVDTVVFPVPPLPLAILIIIRFNLLSVCLSGLKFEQ